MVMRISRLILRVSDLDAAVSFWESSVGLDVIDRSGPFAFLDGHGTQLVLNQVDGPADDISLTEIVIEVDDPRRAYEEMSARGVLFEVELCPVTSDGVRDLLAAHFRDPDGHLASITGWVAS